MFSWRSLNNCKKRLVFRGHPVILLHCVKNCSLNYPWIVVSLAWCLIFLLLPLIPLYLHYNRTTHGVVYIVQLEWYKHNIMAQKTNTVACLSFLIWSTISIHREQNRVKEVDQNYDELWIDDSISNYPTMIIICTILNPISAGVLGPGNTHMRKNIGLNLKKSVRFWDLKIFWIWDFATSWLTKTAVTRSIFEIEGSSFGFFLIFMCLRNLI